MKKKTPILRNGAVQSLLASLLCILLGLLLGYIALLFINPAGAGDRRWNPGLSGGGGAVSGGIFG
jgi:hypothetical protein